MKILLIGHEGQVAWELRRTLACLGNVTALGRTTQPSLDLTQPDDIRATLRALQPKLIVNAAAYTAVDKAEQDREAAYCINAVAVAILAEEAKLLGAVLIHYSTDYVFPGNAQQPYGEEDAVGPLSVYGQSKLAGEEAIRQSGIHHLILRTAWVYGGRGQNFLLTMLRLMRERDTLAIVNDQLGAPTWSRLIAEATALVVTQCIRDGYFLLGDKSGTYHLTCGGETSWLGFAEQIRTLGIAEGLLDETAAKLNPIPTSAYPTPAQRPAYSVLSNDKLAREFGIKVPDWAEALPLCLTDTRPA
jgi:dTDP-4-dehydrorhamnose reductase